MSPAATSAPDFPLVGRDDELGRLREHLRAAFSGTGRTLFLTGESGVGKSRIAAALASEAAQEGAEVLIGHGSEMESGVPYALFADALLPLSRRLGVQGLQLLTRGAGADLARLLPFLAPELPAVRGSGDPSEAKSRVHWSCLRLISGLAARGPVLLLLEDLQWADPSSLELLHLLARQLRGERVLLLGTFADPVGEAASALRRTERSLLAAGAEVYRLSPLGREDVARLIEEAFGVLPLQSRDLAHRLHAWTGGNPFFIRETVRGLVDSARLRMESGRWVGWEAPEPSLPGTVRAAVMDRLERISPEARRTAEIAAVLGTRFSYDVLREACGSSDARLVPALDELRSTGILTETDAQGTLIHSFAHPVLRAVVYEGLGLAAARMLHAEIAGMLERRYGEAALSHADELAVHYLRAGAASLAPRARLYLEAAGRSALARFADAEAERYLAAALTLDVEPFGDPAGSAALLEALARALTRRGRHAEAVAHLASALDRVPGRGPVAARIHRRIGSALLWSGRPREALDSFDAALAACGPDESPDPRIRLERAGALQTLGRPAEARAALELALAEAERAGDPALAGRCHRALLMLYAWTGPPEAAREHGRAAVECVSMSGDPALEWSVRWALAALEGFTSRPAEARAQLERCEGLARELGSPLLQLWTREIALEQDALAGDWESAMANAVQGIALARALDQKALLPRLLVSAALLHFGRGEMELGSRRMAEARELAGAEQVAQDVHTRVPVHAGTAAEHLVRGEYSRAVEAGEAALEIVDRAGYVVWAIHRLLPIVAEAALWLRDVERAERIGERLARDSRRMGHTLGACWAEACGALVQRLRGDPEGAERRLRASVERLDSIPAPVDAARLRRWWATTLAETGRPDEAVRELIRAHERFVRIGARPELSAVREKMRELGARPPARSAPTEGPLSSREAEIASLVARRHSNKAIASELGLSPRTVTTHLTNIFRKIGVSSRAELADHWRSLTPPSAPTT